MPAVDDAAPSKASASIYLTVRRESPDLVAVRLRKWVLEVLSRSIEREIGARARRPVLFGAFQLEKYFRRSQENWRALASTSRLVVVFAEGLDAGSETGADGIVRAALAPGAPLRDEWAVVCDDERFAVVVSGWEVPGQEQVTDAERLFEVVWSFEPRAVRAASRMCADLSVTAGVRGSARLVADLRSGEPAPAELRAVSDVLAVVLADLGEAAPGRC